MIMRLSKIHHNFFSTFLLLVGVLVSSISCAEPPQVSIELPSGSVTLNKGESLKLIGHATNKSSDIIKGDALLWNSDRDGTLGRGETLDVQLSAGVHTLSLTATSPNGEVSRVFAKVTVVN